MDGTHVNDGIQMYHAFMENLRFILRALSWSGSGVGQTINSKANISEIFPQQPSPRCLRSFHQFPGSCISVLLVSDVCAGYSATFGVFLSSS